MNSPRMTRRRLLGVTGSVAMVGGVGGVVGAARQRDSGGDDDSASSTDSTGDDGPTETDDSADGGPFAELYRETIDAVVLVTVAGLDDRPGGLGSGFVIDDEHVVTNQHVVGDAEEVELQFRDEQWRTAAVLGTDVNSDLAVLEVDDRPSNDGVDSLTIADTDPVVGEEVVALGNPLGLDASISQGLVSGVERSLPSPIGFDIPAAIQTDASVNPGNSGGPLVNLEGEALGVVFAGAGQNIGFAISGRLANRVVPALIDDGEYDHAFMGVSVAPVGPAIADANNLERTEGVLVTEIVPDSPAAGVLEAIDGAETRQGEPVPIGGDVIVAIEDEEIPNQERLSATLALETSPGETIDLEVIRDGETEIVELTLESRPAVDTP